ncbi:MAG: cytidylyltransferase domain-containing protein [Aestuariibacter sp.]
MNLNNKKTHAFIFARGGSKGLPGKNIKPLCGKPMICYAIEVAKQSSQISAVYVSTDSLEIAKIAADAGAKVIMRPNELAQDKSPEWMAWRHAINWVIENDGAFELFVSLPVTSPLRELQDVENALEKFHEGQGDVCISVTEAARSPYFNMVKIQENGLTELVIDGGQKLNRRQDVPVVYDITTVAYVTTPQFVLKEGHLFAGKVVSIEVPKHRAVDIDDIYDFKLAEAILSTQKGRGENNG